MLNMWKAAPHSLMMGIFSLLSCEKWSFLFPFGVSPIYRGNQLRYEGSSYNRQAISTLWHFRDDSGYGHSQWEMTLHCNVISHWLSAYPAEWTLHLNWGETCFYQNFWFWFLASAAIDANGYCHQSLRPAVRLSVQLSSCPSLCPSVCPDITALTP